MSTNKEEDNRGPPPVDENVKQERAGQEEKVVRDIRRMKTKEGEEITYEIEDSDQEELKLAAKRRAMAGRQGESGTVFREDRRDHALTSVKEEDEKPEGPGGTKFPDLVKVRIKLEDHYYIFSRFLISRILRLCRVDEVRALEIAKKLKKLIIEQRPTLEIKQSEMETQLFEVERYKMMSRFYQKRVPLLIVIGGTFCIGKSMIATTLGEMLNISNVLSTDIVEIIMNKLDARFPLSNMQFQQFPNSDDMLNEYKRKCRIARKGFYTDIQKCLKEGKPLVIEGFSVDPSLYVTREGVQEESKVLSEEEKAKLERVREYIRNERSLELSLKALSEYNITNVHEDRFRVFTPEPENLNEEIAEGARERVVRKEMKAIDQTGAIVVPILLVINRRDHRYFLENFLLRVSQHKQIDTNIDQLLERNQQVQDYLLERARLVTILPADIDKFDELLNLIHDLILTRIEDAYRRNEF
eukprot:TRINITY_DN10195_c0_g1_i3.p1 TRINITY_DN10195_c0_g1~~TRINITY_DN10195_c0_g1_i3.p1  ORF type:complete len:470 (-),score=151.40 TRINITY_DN10195_c0_g1_i3:75-1484(-)